MAGSKATGVLGVSSAALRRIVAGPLGRRNADGEDKFRREQAIAGDSINAVIEGEIIPKLLMVHATPHGSAAKSLSKEIEPNEARRFADLPLELDAANLIEEVDAFIDAGVSVDSIYIDLLAPAARRLGQMWEDDDCDFVDVTMGLWRLQEVMREIALRTPGKIASGAGARRTALFLPMPGDQHNFGALMIDEVFSRAGWDSEALPNPERRELLDILGRKHFDLVGLTLSRDCPSAAIASLIRAMRSVSANPDLTIMIGGRVVVENPSIVATVGADGTGADARAALREAERLVASAPVRAHIMP